MNGYIYLKSYLTYCEIGIGSVFNAEYVYEIPIQQLTEAQHILHKQLVEFNIQYEAWTPFYDMHICSLIEPLFMHYGIEYRKYNLEISVVADINVNLDADINFLEKSMKSMQIEDIENDSDAKSIDTQTSATATANKQSKKVITEDLGKIFEMAICLLYEIEYDGKYRYSMREAHEIKQKIWRLKEVFPHKLKHVAKNGNKYDFVVVGEEDKLQLSAKTTKKDGKVCPQVIGQPSKEKFCKYFEINDVYNAETKCYNLEKIKHYIQENVNKMLHIYAANTFDCPIIYYNRKTNKILFIRLKEEINWSNHIINFSHIIKNKIWNESSSISIDNTAIGEFQLHNHRNCIKFRWMFEKVLNLFRSHFDIQDLQQDTMVEDTIVEQQEQQYL